MPRYKTTITLQPAQPQPLQKGCKGYLLNQHPVLYSILRTLSMSYTHPSQSSHPVHAINPWPLDAILLPHRKAAETPLDRLYIMYHYIVRGDYNVLRNEVQDFFDHHAWKVYDIPDPHDNDPERYAILAIVTQYLAHGFNRRIKIGGQSRRWKPTDMEIAAHTFFRGTRNLPWQETLEREPKWAKDVPKVPVALVLSKGSWYFPGQRGKSSRFGGKGVVAEEIIECFI